MWERFGTTTHSSSSALQQNSSMREAMEFNFPNVQYILDTLVGSLAIVPSEGNLLLLDQNSELFRKEKRLSILSQMLQARVSMFSDSVLCVGTHAMCGATRKFSTMWASHRLRGGTITSKGTTLKIFDCEFHVNPGNLDANAGSSKNNMFHRHTTLLEKRLRQRRTFTIIIMGTMKDLAFTDKPHRSDEPKHQILCRTFGLGYWVVVRPGSESTWKFDKCDTEKSERSSSQGWTEWKSSN